MPKHTTDEIYDKLTELEGSLNSQKTAGSSPAVTTGELNQKVTDLKNAISEGPKDKATDLKGALSELPVLKETLAILKGGSGLAYIVLGVVAAKAALSTLGIKLFDIQKGVQALSRKAFEGKEITTTEGGRITRAIPEEPQQPRPLPSVTQVNEVKEAIRKLNAEVHTYSSRARQLPSSRNMKQLASAAERLDRVARAHGNVSQLASATNTLEQRFRSLSQAVSGAHGAA